MKILKIEIQNITSLKTDKPIVIDFENKHFHDVGLFAITGSTGAGKTTILDAITIALYHQIPRFKQANIEGGLENIVSYGAAAAFSRVLFENKGERFEALWSLRLVSKAGKEIKPKEEVYLKNISTEKIIAEKKKEVQKAIIEVTQLNYNQFLRSVMLAQGEFASFLSASDRDKGTLLEQITGEEIYKKIGQAINHKQFEAQKKLNDISSLINTEDLLSVDEQIVLKEEQKHLDEKNKDLRIQMLQNSKYKDWYKKQEELLTKQGDLEKLKIKLDLNRTANKDQLLALDLNSKAEPFIELLSKKRRITEQLEKEKVSDESLSKLLKNSIPQSKILDDKLINEKSLLQKEQSEFDNWQKKLTKVAELDHEIKSKKENQSKIELLLNKSNLDFINREKKGLQLGIEGESLLSEIKNTEVYLDKNNKYGLIDEEYATWLSNIKLINKHKEDLETDKKALELTENKLEKTQQYLEQKKLESSNDLEIYKALKLNLETIEQGIGESDINKLIKQKETLSDEIYKYERFLQFSIDFSRLTEETDRNGTKILQFEESIKNLESKFKVYEKEIKNLDIQISDQRDIVELNKTIKNLDQERKNLKKDTACPLCGSLEHPFVEKYQEISLNSAQEELKLRVQKREKLAEEGNRIHKRKVEEQATQNVLKDQQISIKSSLNELNAKVKLLNIQIVLKDTALINSVLEDKKSLVLTLSETIINISNLQSKKDKVEKQLKVQEAKKNELEKNLIAFTERKVNLDKDKLDFIKRVDNQTLFVKKQIEELKQAMLKFNIELPSIDLANAFIVDLKSNIVAYQKAKDNLTNQKNLLSTNKLKIAQQTKELSEKSIEIDNYRTDLKLTNQLLTQILANRNTLLSIETTVEHKSLELNDSLDLKRGNLEQTKDKQSTLQKEIAEFEVQLKNINKQIDELNIEYDKNESDLNLMLNSSSFLTVLEVQKALLPKEQKNKITQIEKEINNENIRLQTLNSQLIESEKLQKDSKDFVINFDKVLQVLQVLEVDKELLLKRIGEISQKFELDKQIKDRNKDIVAKIKKQEIQVLKWKELLNVLGGSKDAFNTYVQRLTLNNLIGFANIHLLKLNPRYSLNLDKEYKKGEELSFKLVDHYQSDKSRYVDTSSGGEKFIISLALALGLSDLSSRNVKIDSLFIDEGFGTLDNNTLETVISTLETLQSDGKMIGIISHVNNLKERIPNQIHISKKSNGISVVDILH